MTSTPVPIVKCIYNFPKGVCAIRKSYWVLTIVVVLSSFSLATLNSGHVSAYNEVLVVRGNTITITSILVQNGSYGDSVPDQRIVFFDQTYNTQLGSDITDTNGVASVSWSIPMDHPLGPTIINATFFGNESLSLAPSCQRTTLTVLASTNIEITQAPEVLAPGDFLSFSVDLKDDSGAPISNATVTVLKNNTPLAVKTTNLSGSAEFDIECNSSWITLGNNEIHVVFEQDLTTYMAASESTFIVRITRISTFLILQDSFPTETTVNEAVEFNVEIQSTNISLSNEYLQLFLDDSFLLQSISNSSGIAPFHVNIDERFMLGFHTLKVVFNGTERYTESYLEIPISVTSPAQITIDLSDSFVIGSDVNIEFTITDLLHRFIPDFSISINDITSNQRFTIPSSSTEITTSFQYILEGPTGIHSLSIEITDNPFMTNRSSNSFFTAWSSPTIILLNCNVDHYASPSQEVSFQIQMKDWAGNCSFKPLHLFIEGEIYMSVDTDAEGHSTFLFSAPHIEDRYNISILYDGNSSLFESSVKYDYELHITHLMPVRVQLDFYEVKTVSRELSVHLIVTGLNGSSLKGVDVSFTWLTTEYDSRSTEGGLISITLLTPITSGDYILYYELKESTFVAATSGSFLIEITIGDIESLQGIGLTGLIIALVVSVGISSIPILRRKYLVG